MYNIKKYIPVDENGTSLLGDSITAVASMLSLLQEIIGWEIWPVALVLL